MPPSYNDVPQANNLPNAALQASRRPPVQHHTNVVIEAGHARARDEVSLTAQSFKLLLT